ncbi:MAG: SpoIID/LytB domain-containing protein [Oscillospiraceae bacterium]|nr:SpoIID/LytB domain-containing protein [Oscillospiraceae bacterium]
MKYIKFFVFVLACFSILSPVGVVSAESYASNPNMRIGLIYDSGIVESFQSSAENGFYFGSVKDSPTSVFDVFFYAKNAKITVVHIANLAKNSVGGYYAANSNIKIGKYNIEFEKKFPNFSEAFNFIDGLSANAFPNPFPAYINGAISVRFGNFSSLEAANSQISQSSKNSAISLKVAADSNKTAVVINPETDLILFQYEDGDNNFAASAANSTNLAYGSQIGELSSNNTAYTVSPAGNVYAGALIYRIKNAGVEVICLISLDDYIKGVLPYEISPVWHEEAMKAFSIAVRTYAIASSNKHSASGFMLCNSAHCQLYLGSNRANDQTNAAVDATKDMVMTYENKIIQAVYHSSSGGVTENHNDAWGGDLRYPYLASVPVPLEKYATPGRSNSLWTNSVSPKELYEYLTGASPQASRFAGKLNSNIAKIAITQRSPNSNYAKSVSVTDVNGNTVQITNSDTIRSTFTRYANSANMDIYKSFKFKSNLMPSSQKALQQDIELGKTYMITANGLTKSISGDGNLNVLASGGKYAIQAYASGNDFIFDGKGWGHGVGLSQWGMQDMAEAGIAHQAILKTFYTGVSIEKLTTLNNGG